MSTMQAAVLVKPQRFDVREVDIPDFGADDILVRIERSSICSTDVDMFAAGGSAGGFPVIPGRELTGRVWAVGSRAGALYEGQRVVADLGAGNSLAFCGRGRFRYGSSSARSGVGHGGSFADYVALPARLVITVPDSVGPEGVVMARSVAGALRTLRDMRAGIGTSAVVLGAGPVGKVLVRVLRLAGAVPVIVMDRTEEHCRSALDAGADAAVADPAELKELVMQMTGRRGVDVVFDTPGSAMFRGLAFDLVRCGGRVASHVTEDRDDARRTEACPAITADTCQAGSAAGTTRDMRDALILLAHGRLQPGSFSAPHYPLDRIQEAFETLPARQGELKTQIIPG
jgi:2-desacetyl-2-hydroxyethyl bacteriochlorophyllide A dehydrogenase